MIQVQDWSSDHTIQRWNHVFQCFQHICDFYLWKWYSNYANNISNRFNYVNFWEKGENIVITGKENLPSTVNLYLAFSYFLLATLAIFWPTLVDQNGQSFLGHVRPSFKHTHLFVIRLMYPSVSQAAFCCSRWPPTWNVCDDLFCWTILD